MSSYTVEIARGWTREVASIAAAARCPTAFQNPVWLSAWYATLGRRRGVDSLIAIVRDQREGRAVALFPLIRNSRGVGRIVEFADLGITDYNAPLWLTDPSVSQADLQAMLGNLIRALQGEGDLLRLGKMPGYGAGSANPLAAQPRARACTLGTNVVRIEGSWESYHRSLDGKVRRELERSWRLFQRQGSNARLVVAPDESAALHILGRINDLQRTRITAQGKPYLLDGEGCPEFYRRLISSGLASGYTVVSALVSGEDEVIAGLICISDGKRLAMLRLGQAGGVWSRCSPGRLLFDRTMQAMHAKGHVEFDFTIGDYPYKETFNVARTPLVDLDIPLTLRGRAMLGMEWASITTRDNLRTVPALYEPLRRIAGWVSQARLGLYSRVAKGGGS